VLKLVLIFLVFSARYAVAAPPPDDMPAYFKGLDAYHKGDYATALRLLRPLADQGDADAQWSIGHLYAEGGLGVPQDYQQAVLWYRKAAEQGSNAYAQTTLGRMYASGRGVPQDFVRAHMWFNLAAAKGDNVAAIYRDDIAKNMTPAQIAEAQRIAREWKPTPSR